jgi:exoribonuclease R
MIQSMMRYAAHIMALHHDDVEVSKQTMRKNKSSEQVRQSRTFAIRFKVVFLWSKSGVSTTLYSQSVRPTTDRTLVH